MYRILNLKVVIVVVVCVEMWETRLFRKTKQKTGKKGKNQAVFEKILFTAIVVKSVEKLGISMYNRVENEFTEKEKNLFLFALYTYPQKLSTMWITILCYLWILNYSD